MRLLAAAAVVLASTSALAQQAPGEVAPLAAPSQPHKDPGTAVAISVGATVGGFLLLVDGASHENGTAGVLGLAGMYFGPSLGVWYGGGTGVVGLGGRLAGFLMVLHGIGLEDSAYEGDCLGLSNADCAAYEAQQASQVRTAHFFEYGGLAVWGAATIYDFVDAHRSASRWNREHELTLAPMLAPHTTGMAVALRF